MVPLNLRRWFIIHFLVDLIAAMPLFAAPAFFMEQLGFSVAETVTPRLVAAAFLAIGANSFLMRNAGSVEYKSMLNLKIIWSSAALIGIVWSILEGAPSAAGLPLVIFSVFWLVWVYYRLKIRDIPQSTGG